MQPLLFIALGGVFGSIARYGVSTYILDSINDLFPWGTLVVNLTGSFLIGVFVELFDNSIVPAELRAMITIGFLGSYTTFSTFSLETVNLFREGEFQLAVMNALVTNIAAIVLVIAGIYSTRSFMKILS